MSEEIKSTFVNLDIVSDALGKSKIFAIRDKSGNKTVCVNPDDVRPHRTFFIDGKAHSIPMFFPGTDDQSEIVFFSDGMRVLAVDPLSGQSWRLCGFSAGFFWSKAG